MEIHESRGNGIVNVGSIASKHSKNSGVGIASSSQVLGAHWSIIFRNEFSEIGVKLFKGQPENWLSWAYGESWSTFDKGLSRWSLIVWNLLLTKIWEQFRKFIEMFCWHRCSSMPCHQLVSDAKRLLGVWAFCNFRIVICIFCIAKNCCYSYPKDVD